MRAIVHVYYRGVEEGLRVHPQTRGHALVPRAPLEALLWLLAVASTASSFVLRAAVVGVAFRESSAVFGLPRSALAVAENRCILVVRQRGGYKK